MFFCGYIFQVTEATTPIPGTSPFGLGFWVFLCLLTLSVAASLFLLRSWQKERRQRKILEREKRQFLIQSERIAVESNRAKSAFIAHVSHEMRTPLNIIIGYSELIAETARAGDDPRLSEDADRVHEAGKQLLNKVNNMLELSKIEAGKVRVLYDRFSIRDLVEEIAVAHQKGSFGDKCSLDVEYVDPPQLIKSDVGKLRQILVHLINNAAQFSESERVVLKVGTDHAFKAPFVYFQIRDQGTGIPEELIPNLFKGFSIAEQAEGHKNRGTGLGLAICKGLSRLLGGDLFVEANPEGGTIFSLRIPGSRDGDTEDPDSVPPIPSIPPQEYKILLIHRDKEAFEAVAQSLFKMGLNTEIASSMEEAGRLARQSSFDGIILDGSLPLMSGWDLIQEMKKDPVMGPLPLILISPMDDISMTYSLGAIGYLTKPVREERVVHMLNLYVPKHEVPVLVVDDDGVSRKVLAKMITKTGRSVVEASTGHQALEVLSTTKPALILLDLMMPEMSGYDFFQNLRDNPDWQQIPVIFVSSANPAEASRLKIAGKFAHVGFQGAYDDPEFLSRLRNQLRTFLKKEPVSMGESS